VSIGNNVTIDEDTFPNNFANFYNRQGKKAGTYTWSGSGWSVK